MSIGKRIRNIRKRKGISQTELGKIVGASKQTIYKYEMGEVKSIPYKKIIAIANALNVTPGTLMGWEDEQPTGIPILGSVPAGVPIEAVQDIIGYEELSPKYKNNDNYFALQIKGDSMFPYIYDKDVVIVHKTAEVNNGDIVIAMVNGYEATCKKLKKMDSGLMLLPNNQDYEPMFYNIDDIKNLPVNILGKVIEIRRKVK